MNRELVVRVGDTYSAGNDHSRPETQYRIGSIAYVECTTGNSGIARHSSAFDNANGLVAAAYCKAEGLAARAKCVGGAAARSALGVGLANQGYHNKGSG